MKQPIICVFQSLRPEFFQQIKKVSQNYQVIDASTTLPEEDDLERIEITLGWDKKLEQKLLSSDKNQLKWVQSISAGVDGFDLKAFKSKQILLSNASGIHSLPITETVIGLLLCHFRGIQTAILQQEKREWKREVSYGTLFGKSVLIVGAGHIGSYLAKSLTAMGAKPFGINRTGHSADGFADVYPQKELDDILPIMDIVINILPLTSETHHFYNQQKFQKMKDGVIFINVGRGPSVDTPALLDALATKKIAFAGIDVVEEEPLPKDHPLWQLENVLITPHIAGLATNFQQQITDIFLKNLTSFLTTEQLALNQIDLTLGY